MTKSNIHSKNFLDDNLIKLLDVTPAPIIISKVDGSFEYVNQALLNMLGYTAEEIYSNDIVVSHPDDLLVNEKIREKLQQDPLIPVTLEKRYLHKSGREIAGLLTMVAELDKSNKVKRFIAQIIDITEHKNTQEDIQLFRTLIDNSTDGMFVINPKDGAILNANQQCCDKLGYSLEEIQSMNIMDITKFTEGFNWIKYVNQVKKKGNKLLECAQKCKGGSIFPVEANVNYIKLKSQYYMIAIVRDISERKKNDEIIWRQANYDSLTNLPNRDMLCDRLEQEIKKSKRSGKKFAVLCLDIDNFKDINDSFGHHIGDKLLIEVAERVKQCTRDSDTVARLGGDEFAIVITELQDPLHVKNIADGILEKLLTPIKVDLNKAYIGASIGINLYPDDGKTIDELLQNADHAMYEVKNNGRNGYKFFTRAMHDKAVARVKLINDLHVAINENQFELVYQPIVDMQTNKIEKAEALIRWNHPTKGMINPDQFIPAAEESGLIIEIGCWVFERVSRQLKEWKKDYSSNMQLSINMSPIQFSDKNNKILEEWFECINKYNLSGNDFTIEITEGVMLNMDENIRNNMIKLRNIGVDIALDDFGTGYSSLSYLNKLDIDYLKIDRSFVQNLDTDFDNFTLCDAIIIMANKLNLKVVAEGIETQQQYMLLEKSGCNYGQGFLFSRPVKADVFTDLFIKDKDRTYYK